MATTLHQVFPAEEYVPGGTLTSIDLTCTLSGRLKKHKLSKVVLAITAEPFSIEEITTGPWLGNYIYATKIEDACDPEAAPIYVTEYLVDVYASANCCLTEPPGPTPEPTNYPYFWAFVAEDPYPDLQANIDTLVYQGAAVVNMPALDIVTDFRAAPLDQWYVVKTRVEMPIYNHYDNSLAIFGPIPDPVWYAPFIIGDWRYYVTRVSLAFDPASYTHLTLE